MADDPTTPPDNKGDETTFELSPFHVLRVFIRTELGRNLAADDSLRLKLIEFFAQNKIDVQHIYLESFALAQLSDDLKKQVQDEKEKLKQWQPPNSNIVH